MKAIVVGLVGVLGAAAVGTADVAPLRMRATARQLQPAAPAAEAPRVAPAELDALGLPLGLPLGRATRADVRAWLSSTGASCRHDDTGRVLSCRDVARPGEPRIDALTVRFDHDGCAYALQAYRTGLALVEAQAHFAGVAAALDRAGAPIEVVGTPAETAQPYTRAERRYPHGALTLSHFEPGSIRLRERYQAR